MPNEAPKCVFNAETGLCNNCGGTGGTPGPCKSSSHKERLEKKRAAGGSVLKTKTGYTEHDKNGSIHYDHEGSIVGFEPKKYAHERFAPKTPPTANSSGEHYEQLAFNFSGQKIRKVTLNGRSYTIAPMSLIVPGVLNGSKGRLYYPAEEVSKNPAIWNGVPLTLGHPTDPTTNEHLSATHPGVVDRVGLGVVKNCRWDGQKLRADGWFDDEHTQNKAPETWAALNSGRPFELSTGLFTSNEEVQGVFNGTPYDAIARNYRSDHVAVLMNERGACAMKDGCGVFNAAEDDEDDEEMTENAFSPQARAAAIASRKAHAASKSALKHKLTVKGKGSTLVQEEVSDRHKVEGRSQVAHGKAKLGDSIGASQDHEAVAKRHEELANKSVHSTPKGKKAQQAHIDAAKAHREAASAHKMTRNSEEERCVFNTETGLCMNCGGKGGKKGPCGSGSGDDAKKAIIQKHGAPPAGQSLATKAERDTEIQTLKAKGYKQSNHQDRGQSWSSLTHETSGHRVIYQKHHADPSVFVRTDNGKKPPTSNQQETGSMDRQTMLSELTANCSCEKEKAAFNELSDDTLKVLHNSKKTKTEPDKVVANSAAPATLTPEQVEVMNYGRDAMQRDKSVLVNRLVANMTDATQKQAMVTNLMQKGIPELRSLVSLLPPVTNQNPQADLQPLFMGAGGGPDPLTTNRGGMNDVQEVKELDWPPTLNYGEISAERSGKA